MTATYKTALRHLMATLEDGVKFAAYHKNNQTAADAKRAMQALTTKLPAMQEIGGDIIAEYEAKKHTFSPQERAAWDNAKAQQIIDVMQEIKPHLEKLAQEEMLTTRPEAENKFGLGYGSSKITATSLLRHINECIEAEKAPERATGYGHDTAPFNGIRFDHKPKPARIPGFVSL